MNTRCSHSGGWNGCCSGPVKNNLCTNHQYWQQHGQMLQWVFAMRQNPQADYSNNSFYPSYYVPQEQQVSVPEQHNSFYPSYYVPQEQQVSVPEHQNSQPYLCSNSGQERPGPSEESEPSYSSASSDSDSVEDNDNDSDAELVFDADGILAMRAAKEELIKDNEDESDSDSIELIDVMVDEKFEFVELDSFGNLQEITGNVKSEPNTKEEFDSAKEWQIYLYGDKAESITCLETPMRNNFDKLSDAYDPTYFPHEL
ncbi:hypothetical protein TNCV_91591 [Trichonephila clavipes]|nr:hypothetical protein TNCV_91591 [Trichonephila clavipes]